MTIAEFNKIINNSVQKNGVSKQLIIDTYFFEKFLYLISISKYSNNFIFKGGFLLENMVGIKTRSTNDIDLKFVNENLNIETLENVFKEICTLSIDDIEYNILSIKEIMEEFNYKGVSIKIEVKYYNLRKTFNIDIATGDIITINAIDYKYTSYITGEVFNVMSYNKETILAEKFETLIKRNISNSRAKDFYDIYLLINNQQLNDELLHSAIVNTFNFRKTNITKENITNNIELILKSEYLRDNYYNYSNRKNIKVEYEKILECINILVDKIKYIEPLKLSNDFVIIRHGEDNQLFLGGHSDNSLTNKGIQQAESLKDNLKVDSFDFIYSSDLNRAKETANVLFNKYDITFTNNLREIDNGIYKNMKVEVFNNLEIKHYFSNLDIEEKYPNGESPSEFFNRVKDYFININNTHENKKIAIVCHGGPMLIIKSLIDGYKWSNKQKNIFNYASIYKKDIDC